MKLYKVIVSVRGKSIQSIVKPGMLASAEVKCHCEEAGTLKPRDKMNVVAGLFGQQPAAWVQLLRFSDTNEPVVTHEGWITAQNSSLASINGKDAEKATVEEVITPTPEMIKCQEEATFGAQSCCTYNGTTPEGYACSVQCCGGCCSVSDCGGCCP